MKRKTKRTYQQIMDDATRHQVYLERLKSSLVKDAMVDAAKVERATVAILRDLESDQISDLTRRELDALLARLRAKQLELYAEQNTRLLEKLEGTSAFSAQREADVLDSWVTRLAGESDRFKVPSATDAWKAVNAMPVRATGELLGDFVASQSLKSIKRLEGVVRNGWASGGTIGEMTRAIVGTKAKGYKDGIGAENRRNTETVIRTATQHVANTARMSTWEKNDDVVKGYIIIATLDSVTTTICRSLDKKRFKLGKGPVPPFHANCRTTTIADLGPDFAFLDKGATRSSAGGYVDAKLSYYDWLKTQDEAFVKDALGAKRAQLFTKGGLSADEFAKLNLGRNFEPLTLAEMKELDAAAFARAGLN